MVRAIPAGSGSGGGGTVTSVGLSMPAIFSVANSPVVGAGTLTVTLGTQGANKVWAGPSSGADATPTFRALVSDDIPSLAFSKLTSSNLTENVYMGLVGGLSADGKFSGIAIDGTAGATLAFGDLCYLAVADSRWELADADAASTAGDVVLGICILAAANDGDATRMLLYGTIRADAAFPTLTIGAPVYASTTAGDVQVAQPSGTDDVIRVVGFALTADSMLFCPSPDYITHT